MEARKTRRSSDQPGRERSPDREQLGYGAENGTWRNFFLSGAAELRSGPFGTPAVTASADVIAQLSPTMLFDALAVRVDGPRAWDERLTIDVRLSDADETYRLRLRNGVLTYSASAQPDAADATLVTTRSALPALALPPLTPEALAGAGIEVVGDAGVLGRLGAVLEVPDPDFAIVTAEKD